MAGIESKDELFKTITIFDAAIVNWPDFKFKMDSYLQFKEFDYIIEQSKEDYEMTVGEKEKESKMKKWKKDNLSTMTYLVAKLSPEILQLVKDKKTAYEMWEKLEQS
ncbi:hypothetical protein HK101_005951 [Irineochytrium annulatum]|nr:hypothetical protein HK101_005951 [Irineochytrium annulatum]